MTAKWRWAPLGALLAAICLAHPAGTAAQPTYTFDVDPVRLGNKAFEEGRLADAAARYEEAINAGYQTARARFGLAEIAAREGRDADAEFLYRLALKEKLAEKGSPDYPEAHAGLGLVLLELSRDAEAAIEFDRALNGRPGLWEAQYGQARILLGQQKWEEARRLLEKGASRKGLKEGEDRYHYGMGVYDLGTGNLAGAEGEAILAFSLNPGNADYGTLVAQVYEKKGVPALAIDAYEKAFAAPGMTPTAAALTNLGRLYQEVQRFNDARDAYLKAVAADSTYAPALKSLARLYEMAGQADRASRIYLRYVQIEKTDVEALLGLAAACQTLKQYAQALEAARAAMAVDSSRVDVRVAFARAGLQSHDGPTRLHAASLYTALPDSARTRPEDEILAAAALIESRRFPEAQASLGRALKLNPALPEVWFQLGMLDMNSSRPDSAVTHFGEATRRDPENALYQLNLGIALFQVRRSAQAIPVFRKAVALNDKLTIGRVLLGQALVLSDSVSAAMAEYRQVLEVEPANPRALRGLGYCWIRKANYKEAARAYRAAAEAEPGNADAWAGLGNANLGLQNWQGAEEAFRKAQAIDPENPTLKKGMELLNNAKKAAGGG